MIRELLARLQPGGMNTEPTSRATGARIEVADIALALASVPHKGGRALVSYLYAGQDDQAAAVVESVRSYYKHCEYDQLVSLYLHERKNPGTCPACEGRGTAWRDTLLVACPACKGSGRQRISETSRARWMQISRPTWYKNWQLAYIDVTMLLDEWESLSIRKIKHLLV